MYLQLFLQYRTVMTEHRLPRTVHVNKRNPQLIEGRLGLGTQSR